MRKIVRAVSLAVSVVVLFWRGRDSGGRGDSRRAEEVDKDGRGLRDGSYRLLLDRGIGGEHGFGEARYDGAREG